MKSDFLEITSKFSCVRLSLEKLIKEKHFSVKEKSSLVSRKVFFFYFRKKNTF
jgi:hypothetical protein